MDAVLVAAAVGVRRGPRWLLAPTSVTVVPGEVRVVAGDPGHGHTALALALAGRLSVDAGRVSLGRSERPKVLQRAVALVDVAGVSEPDDANRVTTVLGEELAMAGQRAGRRRVRRWLAEHQLSGLVGRRMEDVSVADRVTLLARTAALRPGVRFLVLTLPESHGGDVDDWLPTLSGLAADGLGVLVTTSAGVARHLDLPTVALGNADEPAPAPERAPTHRASEGDPA